MTQATGTAGTIRRTFGTVAAVLATASLLAGCGSKDEPAAAPQDAPSVSPKEALVDAVPDGTEGTFRFSGKDASSTLTGLIDHESKAFELNTTLPPDSDGIAVKMSFLVIGDDTWMKAKFTGRPGLPKLPDKWMKLDPAKLTDAASIPTYDGADQGNAGRSLRRPPRWRSRAPDGTSGSST